MKNILIGFVAGLAMLSTAAVAAINTYGITIHSVTPIYNTVKHYETVEVCTQGDEKIAEGAILGGILGNNTGSGDAIGGAIIGGLIGAIAGGESCKTEKRVSHTTQELVGYTVYLRSPSGELSWMVVPL